MALGSFVTIETRGANSPHRQHDSTPKRPTRARFVMQGVMVCRSQLRRFGLNGLDRMVALAMGLSA
jgi:hypothetical protein